MGPRGFAPSVTPVSAGSPTARPRTATTTLPRRIVHHVRRNAPLVIMDAVTVLTSYLMALVLRLSGQLPDFHYYWKGYEKVAMVDLTAQAEDIAKDLQKMGAPAEPQKEIIALIAYLQRLGVDIKAAQ